MNDLNPTKDPALFLSQILSSQICHDIASPIGALLTGIELLPLEEMPESQEIIDLLQNTGRVLKNRLEMFRAAFTSGGQILSARQAKTLILEYFDLQEKMNFFLDWPLEPLALPKGAFQLLINILMWMAQKTPKGGTLKMVMTPTHPLKIKIHLTAPMIFIRPDDADILTGKIEVTALQPQTVQTYFIYLLSTVFHQPLDIQKLSDEEVNLCLHLEKKGKVSGDL